MARNQVRQWTLAIGLFLGLSLVSCIEEIELDDEDFNSLLVLDGRITPEKARVKLANTTFNNRNEVPIEGATVVVLSQEGQELPLSETKPGLYESRIGTFAMIPGEAYHVRASLRDGRVYRSRPDTLPSVVAEDQVSWSVGTDQGRDVIVVKSEPQYPANQGPVYTLWEFVDAFVQTPTNFPDIFNRLPPNCYIERKLDLQAVVLYDGSRFQGRSPGSLTIGRLFIDDFFDEKHVISVEQYSITRQAFQYWQLAARLLEQDGSLFDPPPGLLRGNVFREDKPEEPVRGYVTLAQTQVTRFAIYPSDLPMDFMNLCE
ncbi:MAG: DUF4249 domain-containing protein, partial [Bacteroidota bacterium]